jgi:molybdate transport system substrate-binding protein
MFVVLASVIAAAIPTGVASRPAAQAGPAAAPVLNVAAAADLRYAFEEIGAAFERRTGTRVQLSLGSSGQLAAQVEQGAPFDLIFSADEEFVRRLAERGAVRSEAVQLYAIGRIVLWVRNASPLDVERGLGVLGDPRVRFVAIANPAHAPYGEAARRALVSGGMYERVRTKLVLGGNVSLALQLVQTGNADAGIVALSLALAPPVAAQGRYWLIPEARHAPIRQAAGVVARSSQPDRARSFLAFVNGTEGRPIMRRYGFYLPGEGR